jgi:long-chain acyl-CoA synthetase
MLKPTGDLLITGATGLVGGRVLERILGSDPDRHVFVLVRDPARWHAHALRRRIPASRLTAVQGDLTQPGLGLRPDVRAALERRVHALVHSAADVVFSRSLEAARRVNTTGTERVVELAAHCNRLTRFVHVSTAFVAGRRTGRVFERDNGDAHGFVNAYEQSKYEGERAVRDSGLPWVVVRPSSIVCDGPDGHVSQFNAAHLALRLCHAGLSSMIPGDETNPVDFVPADYVADCIALFLRAAGVEGATFHVCTGDRAISLGELLGQAYAIWSESREWRRRGIPRPALTDLETYRLFERAVQDTADERLRAITRSLSHFIPQVALPKWFDTSHTEAVTRRQPPEALHFWPRVIRHLVDSRWAAEARRAA